MSEQDEEKIIQAEYMQWRKNIQYLYNMVLNHALDWPALSVQFFPDHTRQDNTTTQRMLISTHTSGQEQEFLQIVELNFPDTVIDYDDEDEAINNTNNMKFRERQRIPVTDEVNRACYNPNKPELIATRSDNKIVHIYDYTKHLSKSEEPNPDIILEGHESGGYGLAWNPVNKNILITAGEDQKICMFDIENKILIHSFCEHSSVVNDVSFGNEFLFASVGDDKKMIFWDTRAGKKVYEVEAANSDVLCVEFNPIEENILATGSADSLIKIWDIRNLNQSVITNNGGSNVTSVTSLKYHTREITQVRWSPHVASLLASSSTDRRVVLWDLSKDDPLSFIHGGHTNVVTDICWNPIEKYELVSVAEDNILQIWSPVREEQQE